MIVRILIWSLSGSKTTVEELRDSVALLEPPDTWMWNEASERFGLVSFDEEELPEAAAHARELIGADPDVYEEFDTL